MLLRLRLLPLVALSVSVVLIGGAFASKDKKNVSRPAKASPNILLISLCSVRPDHMSCNGYKRKTTPNFDKLAQSSIVFKQACTQWPKTVPAFTAIMTGKYGHSTGVMRTTPGQALGEEHQTLAEVLHEHGYATAAFISTGALNRNVNLHQGFDVYVQTFRLRQSFRETTKRAAAWIKRNHTTPFFVWAHYNNAHYPYSGAGAPKEQFVLDERYSRDRKVPFNRTPLALDIPAEHPFARQLLRPDIGGVHKDNLLSAFPDEYDFYLARYDAGIFGADRMAGDLLKTLNRSGLLKNTIVVLVGDHGESLGEHDYFFEHGRFPYNACGWVPMMIRPAGGCKPICIRSAVGTFQLAPTLLTMLGVETPDSMEARAVTGIFAGEGANGYVFAESGYQLDYTISVTDGRWKLIHIPNEVERTLMIGEEYELYDTAADPNETTNLAAQKAEVYRRLKSVLETWSAPWKKNAYQHVSNIRHEKPVDEKVLEQLRALGYAQ